MNTSNIKLGLNLKLTYKIAQLILVICFVNGQSIAQNAYVYNGGTNWQPSFYDIIKSGDATTFKSVSFEIEKNAEMWDRDANNNQGAWITPKSWIFQLTYDDGIVAEIRIRQLGFTKDQAVALAEKYGKKMGQLPACLRKGVDYINIMKSDALFGGNNFKRSIDITIGETSELYERTGNMEETLFHESTHAALDYLYRKDWKIHRNKDPKFISKYAADNPNREDISESFLLYAALNYRNNRITSEVARIKANISNRLAYYEKLKLEMHPFSKSKMEQSSPFDSNAYYRLTSQWQGEGKSLDILNDGKNNQPILAKTADVTGQMWKIEKTGTDIYTLSTKWQGSTKILDCIQGPNQNRPILNQESGYSGGAWKIILVGDGFYQITNMWLSDRSLDVINDGENNKIQVAKTGNYSGQFWKITKIK